MNKVLILCTGNSCRSQMAEGWLRYFTRDRIQVYSAGTCPEAVNKYAIQAMQIHGIDISNYSSNKIDDYIEIEFDFVITVCDNANKKCPYFPKSNRRIHKSFSDPANATGTDLEKMQVYKDICRQLQEYFKIFADQNFPEINK